jgi:hypothetical protein
MPNVFEPAASGRAKCRGCDQKIVAGEVRFGERLPNPFAEGELTVWFHCRCAAFKRPEPFLETLPTATEPIDERESLEREAALGAAHRRVPRVDRAERAPSGRAKCRACREAIEKDGWRIALVFWEEGRFVPSGFIHARCAAGYLETADILPRLRHFSPGLTDDELAEIAREL